MKLRGWNTNLYTNCRSKMLIITNSLHQCKYPSRKMVQNCTFRHHPLFTDAFHDTKVHFICLCVLDHRFGAWCIWIDCSHLVKSRIFISFNRELRWSVDDPFDFSKVAVWLEKSNRVFSDHGIWILVSATDFWHYWSSGCTWRWRLFTGNHIYLWFENDVKVKQPQCYCRKARQTSDCAQRASPIHWISCGLKRVQWSIQIQIYIRSKSK